MLAIRTFRSADLEALYAISLATGHEGGDASHLYKDRKLIGHIYSAPYALLEPRLALVVEDDEGVAGFAVGTPDTGTWQERLEAEWWPKASPTIRRSCCEAGGRMVRGPAPRDTLSIARGVPLNRLSSSIQPHLHLNLLERDSGTWRWNDAVLGVDGPRLAEAAASTVRMHEPSGSGPSASIA